MRHITALLLLGLTLPLVTLARAQTPAAPAALASDDGTVLARKFEFLSKRPVTPALKAATDELALVRNQFNAGVATEDRRMAAEFHYADVQRHCPYVFSLHSHGGTLRELAARMSMSGEFNFTIVNAGDASDLEIPLPEFELRNVSWRTIIEVLDNFLAPRRLQLRLAGSEDEDLSASRSVVCVLRRTESSAGPDQPSSGFDSFQLSDYLSGQQTVDTIVDAIRTAWTMDPTRSADALQIKYHPATNMLFVSGPQPAISIARQVIAGLRQKKPLIP